MRAPDFLSLLHSLTLDLRSELIHSNDSLNLIAETEKSAVETLISVGLFRQSSICELAFGRVEFHMIHSIVACIMRDLFVVVSLCQCNTMLFTMVKVAPTYFGVGTQNMQVTVGKQCDIVELFLFTFLQSSEKMCQFLSGVDMRFRIQQILAIECWLI